MIYSIDGTGPSEENAYRRDMDRGFCNRITRRFKSKLYLRGPTDLGPEMLFLSAVLTKRVVDDVRKRGVKEREINLMGYSRGGAACIDAAYKLKSEGIRVNSMLLFDAVDRTIDITYWTACIPSNVKQCLHFVRSEAFSNLFHHLPEYKRLSRDADYARMAAGGKGFVAGIGSGPAVKLKNLALGGANELSVLEDCHQGLRNACRFDVQGTGFSFGHAGLKADPGVAFVLKYVSATHGAMGGAPLAVETYIPAPKYRPMIELSERKAMQQIETGANCFLSLVGESGALN